VFLPSSSSTRSRRRERLFPALAIGGVILLVLVVHLVEGGGSTHTPATARKSLPRVAPITRSAKRASMEAEQHSAIERVLAYAPYISRGSSRRREVAITFDDGPGSATRQILHILHRYHAQATFFQVGRMVRSFPLLAREEVADGHAVGTHTNNHARLNGMPLSFQQQETNPGNEQIPGYAPNFLHLFRPPYGGFDTRTLAIMHQQRTLIVLWSVNPFDYLQPGVKTIVKRTVKGAFPGAIVLLHDAGGYTRQETVRALPAIIKGLRHRHLKLVTVPRMVLDDPPPRQQPRAVGPG
jgi:peptidoglycan/xylan/chitin deacetylase (PgdA/CDA1 family)